jgi:hypothetical protein
LGRKLLSEITGGRRLCVDPGRGVDLPNGVDRESFLLVLLSLGPVREERRGREETN